MCRASRILVLVCGLLLTLPPGWCCIFARPLARLAAGMAPVERECCKSHKRNKPQEPQRDLPADRCPCSGRQTVLTGSAVEQVGPDLAPIAILPTV
jgi:hypothetical protein